MISDRDRIRRTVVTGQWDVLMQPENRYLMTPGVRHSGIVNWLIYLYIYVQLSSLI